MMSRISSYLRGASGQYTDARPLFAAMLVVSVMAFVALTAWGQGAAVQGIRKSAEKLGEGASSKGQQDEQPAEKKPAREDEAAKKERLEKLKAQRAESRKKRRGEEQPEAAPNNSPKNAPKKSAAPAAETEPRDIPPGETDSAKGEKDAGAEAAGVTDLTKFPKLTEMEIPTAQQLLLEPPVDWIVLKLDDRVIVTGLVFPRPDTLTKMAAALEQASKGGRAGDDKDRAARQQQREDATKLSVTLPDDPDKSEFRLDVKHVDRIIYHEDLMLKRINLLMEQGVDDTKAMREAFEMLNGLERRVPDWPGVTAVQNRLLYYEALYRVKKNEPEAALVYLEDLYAVAPKFPDLRARVGEVADQLISAGFQAEDYRRARHFLSRLRALDAEHPVVLKWDQAFNDKASALLKQALAESKAGKPDVAAETVKVAAGIWPRAQGLKDAHAALTNRYQTLNVGVVSLPHEPSAYFLPTDADKREHYLTEPALFEVADVREKAVFRSSYFEEWEPLDLGRRVRFTLRQTRNYWESHPVATASRVVSWLSHRIDRSSPMYDERFAGYVKMMKVLSPFEFEMEFARVPLAVEGLLFPPPAERRQPAAIGTNSPTTAETGDEELVGRFQVHERTENRVSYVRTIPEPDDAPVFHVARIDEIKFKTYGLAVQSLLRGDLDMLPHVRSADVARFQADDRFVVQQYAVPVTHMIQINPRSKPLANRELRRALMYALDREQMLKEIILKDPNSKGERGRLVSAPYPKSSLGYDGLVEMPQSDLTLAFALGAAAQKQAKANLPQLTMLCAPDPIVQEAAAEIVRRWKAVGFNVELVTASPVSAAQARQKWDIIYRTVQIVEPSLQLWPLLTLEPYARVQDIQYLPDQLRMELLGLESAPDWSAANATLRRLHQKLLAEVQFIPLWEVDDYIVFRKAGVGNFDTRPVHTYQDIDQWTTRAWYPNES